MTLTSSSQTISSTIMTLPSQSSTSTTAAFATSTILSSGTLTIAYGLTTSKSEPLNPTLGPILLVNMGEPPEKVQLMHLNLALGPLRGPPSGSSCPPILALICNANNVGTTGPVDDTIIDPSDDVTESDNSQNNNQNSDPSDQKTKLTQSNEDEKTASETTRSQTASNSSTSTITSSSQSTSSSSRTSSSISTSSSSSSSSITTAAPTPYVIVGNPGVNDQAITNYLQQILTPAQFSHIQYQLDEAGATGSDWYFGDNVNGTNNFVDVPGLNQSQIQSVDQFSGVGYGFPDVAKEDVGNRPNSNSNTTIVPDTNLPSKKRSGSREGNNGLDLLKRVAQVEYTRQVGAYNELKFISQYYVTPQPAEQNLELVDYVYETPAGAGTWVYVVSEFYDPNHRVSFYFLQKHYFIRNLLMRRTRTMRNEYHVILFSVRAFECQLLQLPYHMGRL